MFSANHLGSKVRQLASSSRCARVAWLAALACVCWCALPAPPCVPAHLRVYILFEEGFTIPEKQLSKDEIARTIFEVERLNAQANVLNWDKYRPVRPDTTIITVLVHRDVERLQYLIASLGQVRYIAQVLLIFSHSYFDEEINYLVKSISFCKVLQIFYPYSLQLYPNQFPGVGPDDCNSTVAASGRCFERDARRVLPKHHWWWTAHYVFEGEWRSKRRIVMFLQEDDLVLPDLLYMLEITQNALPYLPETKVLSFGGPLPRHLDYDELKVDSWTTAFARGLALNLNTWREISERSSFFCFYDDCRWSNSLYSLFGNFSGGFASMVACSVPRVLSTREFASGRRAACWAARAHARGLFPQEAHALLPLDAHGRVVSARHAEPHGAGGWSNLRDQTLCLNPLMTSS